MHTGLSFEWCLVIFRAVCQVSRSKIINLQFIISYSWLAKFARCRETTPASAISYNYPNLCFSLSVIVNRLCIVFVPLANIMKLGLVVLLCFSVISCSKTPYIFFYCMVILRPRFYHYEEMYLSQKGFSMMLESGEDSSKLILDRYINLWN